MAGRKRIVFKARPEHPDQIPENSKRPCPAEKFLYKMSECPAEKHQGHHKQKLFPEVFAAVKPQHQAAEYSQKDAVAGKTQKPHQIINQRKFSLPVQEKKYLCVGFIKVILPVNPGA